MIEILKYLLVAIAAYLLGSFSTGILVANKLGHDIRSEGSKNTGASNALRVLGLKGGAIVFLGDFIKASIAVMIGHLMLGMNGAIVGGLCVVLGHNWPIFFGFKGGKGIACSAAIVLLTFWWQGLIAIVICLAVIYFTRYISLGSMTMLFSYMIFMCIAHWGEWFTCLFCVILFVLCVIRHRSNIGRLLNGTENKIGQKVKPNQQTEESK